MLKGHVGPVAKVKYNREGDLIFSSARKDSKPVVWYAHSGERLGTFNGHEGMVGDFDIDFQSKRFLTASADRHIKLWDCQNGNELASWQFRSSVRGVQWATGDRMMLAITDNNFNCEAAVHIWNLPDEIEEAAEARMMAVPGVKLTGALWGPLNTFVVAAGDDGCLRKWDVEKGVEVEKIEIHKKGIKSMTPSKDGSMFITASSDYTAKLFDMRSLALLKTYKDDRPLNAAAISPIMNHVIVGGGQDAMSVTQTAAKAGHFETDFFHTVYMDYLGSVKGHFGPINTLAFSPDGKSFASGSEDGYIRLHHFDDDYFNSKQW